MSQHDSEGQSSDHRKSSRKRSAHDTRAEFATACREILDSPEGRARLRAEILDGNRESFWKGVERAHGKAPLQVEVSDGDGFQVEVDLDGLSDAGLRFLALLSCEQHAKSMKRRQSDQRQDLEPNPITRQISGGSQQDDNEGSEEPAREPHF